MRITPEVYRNLRVVTARLDSQALATKDGWTFEDVEIFRGCLRL